MNAKEEFIQIYKENIHREGADAFLEFLEGPHSDFFTAPASTRVFMATWKVVFVNIVCMCIIV